MSGEGEENRKGEGRGERGEGRGERREGRGERGEGRGERGEGKKETDKERSTYHIIQDVCQHLFVKTFRTCSKYIGLSKCILERENVTQKEV